MIYLKLGTIVVLAIVSMCLLRFINGKNVSESNFSMLNNRRLNEDTTESPLSTNLYLHAIRDQIMEVTDNRVWYDGLDFGRAYGSLKSNKYVNYTHDMPIMVLKLAGQDYQFGNRFGSFLTDFACGIINGAHLVIIDATRHYEQRGDHQYRFGENFFNSIPHVYVNKHPATNRTSLINRYEATCISPSIFPWDFDYPFPVNKLVPLFKKIMLPSLHNQLIHMGIGTVSKTLLIHSSHRVIKGTIDEHEYNNYQSSTNLPDLPDLNTTLTAEQIAQLPLYPDVVIHYRCSDNVAFDRMGLLPFRHIISHIPVNTKYIMILTEGTRQGTAAQFYKGCPAIVDALRSDVAAAFPTLEVVIRQGGHIFEVFALLIHSRIVICSSSSFCFYIATSNPHGHVYFPKRYFLTSHTQPEYINHNRLKTIPDGYSIYEWRATVNGTNMREPYGEGDREGFLQRLTPEFVMSKLRNTTCIYKDHSIDC